MSKELVIINQKIAEAEKNHDRETLDSLLSSDLLFRRASGATTDKNGFLKDLENVKYDYIFNEDEIVNLRKNEAIVTLIVRAKIEKLEELDENKQPKVVEGAWLNNRWFRKEQGEWKLYRWFNEQIFTDILEKQKQIASALLKDYELKVAYLKDHYSRMWTRFNFFLTLETTLIGGKVFFMNSTKEIIRDGGNIVREITSSPETSSFILAIAGIFVSILWFLMSAQDSYLGRVYRAQAQEAGLACRRMLDTHPTLAQIGDTNFPGVGHQIFSWRLDPISSTKLPALVALIAVVLWIAICFS